MANAVVIAFNGPDVFNSDVMGVFTVKIGSQPKVWTMGGNDTINSETLPVGGEMHPDLVRAIELSGETQNMFSVTPCGQIKVLTCAEHMNLPSWAAHAAVVEGVNPV